MPSKHRKHVAEVVSEHPKNQQARLHLFGYTAVTIATMTQQHYNTVARHIKAGKLDLSSLESVRQYLYKRIKTS